MSFIIGIDNGTTGSITILNRSGVFYDYKVTPSRLEQSYTKTKQNISRIDVELLREMFEDAQLRPHSNNLAVIERPMINPMRFKASISAARALEATLIVIEELRIPYRYIDSKEWQKAMLPSGCEKDELKGAAVDVARRLFPSVKVKDADSILIAEYARRHYK